MTSREVRDAELCLCLLDAEGVVEACRHTHPLWNQGRDFDAYTQRVEEALVRMDGTMRYLGLFHATQGLVATARELDTFLNWQGQAVRAMGIAAVFVREDQRGNGIGRALMRHLLNDAKAQGYHAAFLFSDIGPTYYAAHGFHAYPALDWHALPEQLPTDAMLAIRRAQKRDIRRMIEWYHASACQGGLSVRRAPVWWTYFRWWRDAPDDYILCHGSKEVGYLNVRLRGDRLHVYEWAAPGIDAELVWGAVRARAADYGANLLTGWYVPWRKEPWMVTTERSAAIPMVIALQDDLALPDADTVSFEELDHF